MGYSWCFVNANLGHSGYVNPRDKYGIATVFITIKKGEKYFFRRRAPIVYCTKFSKNR